MEQYEYKETKWLMNKPGGLFLERRRQSLRRAGVERRQQILPNN